MMIEDFQLLSLHRATKLERENWNAIVEMCFPRFKCMSSPSFDVAVVAAGELDDDDDRRLTTRQAEIIIAIVVLKSILHSEYEQPSFILTSSLKLNNAPSVSVKAPVGTGYPSAFRSSGILNFHFCASESRQCCSPVHA